MKWLLLMALAGCSRGGEENLGLRAEHAVTVDIKQLATPLELKHALQIPGAELDKLLGARHVEARSTLKIEPTGRPAESLEETYRVDSDGKGALHLVHDNTRDGMEAIVEHGTLYVRPRYGHWAKRRPEGDDVERLRDNVEGVAGSYVELLEHWLSVKEVGKTEVNGRPALRLSVSAVAAPGSAPPATLAYKKWRDTLKVRYVNGEWVMDAASGAPLAGKMEASYTFERSDLKGPVTVTVAYEQHGGALAPIVAPTDAVEPRRERPLLDRETLLEGLTAVKAK